MNIKDIRAAVDMSQKEFSKEFGIPLRTLQSWEIGERKPAQYIVDLILRVVRKENKMKNVIIIGDLTVAFTAWVYNDKVYYGYCEHLTGEGGYISLCSFQNGGRNYGDSAETYERIEDCDYFGDMNELWNEIISLPLLDGCFDVTDFELN